MTVETVGVGTSISHYRILSRLGAGGMGEVYLAEDIHLRRRVALKLLSLDLTKNKDRLRRLEQEAQAASALNHPNIIKIHEFGQADLTHFIATEFIKGVTLRQRMVKGGMGLNEVLDVAMQTASALAAAHEAGVVHRDIKPENIMLRSDGIVKVLDFGLAKLTENEKMPVADTEAPTREMPSTAPGIVMGTVSYMSAEQASGLKDIDELTDIWSLGVVIYEMVARRLPFGFDGATLTQVISLIIQKEATPLKACASEIPDELNRIVMKALENRRADRYQNVNEMLVDLTKLDKHLQREAEQERTIPPESGSDATAAPAPPVADINVAIVEDHHKLRDCLEFLLNNTEGYRCTGSFRSMEEALEKISFDLPDLALLDIGLPGMTGVEGAALLKQRHPNLLILMNTVYDDDERIFDALCAGASGYLLKKTSPAQLLESIKTAMAGGAPMSPEVARRVIRLFREIRPPERADYHLTPHELRLLKLLAEGHSYKTAAVNLGVTGKTVSFHLQKIYEKLQVHSKSEAVSKALRNRLIK